MSKVAPWLRWTVVAYPRARLVGADLVGPQGVGPAVVHPHRQAAGIGVDADHVASLRGDQLSMGGGSEGDDAVPSLVDVAGHLQLRSGQPAGLAHGLFGPGC